MAFKFMRDNYYGGRGLSPGMVGWSPSSLGASLLAWWSADRSDLITLLGSAVTSWKDVVGGYDATQGISASRGLYGPGSFNGSPGVTFDGVDDQFTCTTSALISQLAALTATEMWGLVQQDAPTSDGNNRIIIGQSVSNATNSRYLFRRIAASINRLGVQCGNGSSSVVSNEGTIDFTGRHVARGVFGPTTTAAEIDGVSSVPSVVSPFVGAISVIIGGRTSDLFWQGVMRDVLITRPLDVDQASKLTSYLNARRNL